MQSKWKFFVAAFIVSVVSVLFHRRHDERSTPVLDKTAQMSRQKVEKFLTSIEENTEPDPSVPVSDGTRQKLTRAFDFMIQARHSLHRDEERHSILSKLMRDPHAVDAAAKYLQDPLLVREHFADKQAEARIFSIDLLAERAKTGDTLPLKETTRHVAHELSSLEKMDPGRRRDLEDLIGAFVQIEKDTALDDLDRTVSELGYHPSLREPFIVGISIALQGTYPKEEIIKRLEQAGIEVFRKERQG